MKKAFAALLFTTLIVTTACSTQSQPQSQSTTTPISQQSMTSTVSVTNNSTDPQLAKPQPSDTVAIMDTDFGTIKFKLFTAQVPEMTKNFTELAKAGKYDGVPFHRVIKDFMIQTGDFTNKDGTGGYSYKGPGTELADEIAPSLHHLYGTVSMANAGPNTNGSQFFIVTNQDGFAQGDGTYSIFGQVYSGMDVAEKIADLYIPSSGGTGTPSKIVNVKKVTITTYGADQKGK
jgi:peptidyl-prolyl cis-trans isomerase B (cyclophilin B)